MALYPCHIKLVKRSKGKSVVAATQMERRGSRNWVFSTEDKELLRVDHISIVHHTKVRIDANKSLKNALLFNILPYMSNERYNLMVSAPEDKVKLFGKTGGR